MRAVADVRFTTLARGETRFGLRPTRLSPHNPKDGQLLCDETRLDESKTSRPHRSG